MEIYRSFPEALARFARSLIIEMNVYLKRHACSKLDVIVLPRPLLKSGGNHILVISVCSKYMHQKLLFFGAQNAKFSLPWEGDTPSHADPPPARSLRSLAILLADYFRRACTKQSGRGASRWVEIFDYFYKILCTVFYFFFWQTQR